MELCDTCIYQNENEYHKPCIVRRDDCKYYERRDSMCPDNCKIVKDAQKAHEERGVSVREYVEYFKESNALCALCTHNEKAGHELEHLKTDVSEGWI